MSEVWDSRGLSVVIAERMEIHVSRAQRST
jgi:hypothetical protein